jgi:hypothetical protein
MFLAILAVGRCEPLAGSIRTRLWCATFVLLLCGPKLSFAPRRRLNSRAVVELATKMLTCGETMGDASSDVLQWRDPRQ